MLHGRYESVGCYLEENIYVAGGTPAELVGRNIEKYVINNDTWESLDLVLY
jgi:hypothetical protein